MKKYILGVSGLVVALLIILGLSFIPFRQTNSSQKPIRVIAGMNFYGEAAKAVAGKYGKVTTLIDNSSVDPHDYQPSTSQAKSVASANVVIENGLGYDQWLSSMVKSSNYQGQSVINVAKLMNKKSGQNEHLWYQPETIKKLTQELATEYGKLDPSHKSYYQKNANKYLNSLEPLDKQISQIKAYINSSNNKVAVSEPVFDYALEALGYKVIDSHFAQAIEEGNDPSPKDIQSLQTAIKQHKIAFFVENSQTTNTTVNSLVKLARKNNVPVLKVTETRPSNKKNYLDWMLSQYKALAKIQLEEK